MPEVIIYEDADLQYPESAPFSASTEYPEFASLSHSLAPVTNEVYAAVRNTLAVLGLDRENFGTDKWNPLGKYIPPGGSVLIKPNLVHHSTYHVADKEVVLTNGSVIRAMVDYAVLACGLNGKVTIGDSPMMPADFDKIVDSLGLNKIVEYYKEHFDFTICLEDFRLIRGIYSETGYLEKVINVEANNHTDIKLRNTLHSHFESNFEVTDSANPAKTYTLHNAILTADCVINIPKLKTHKIAGMTCCLKAFIGASSNKNQILPHYRKGGSDTGGDEYEKETMLMKLKRHVLARLKKGPRIIFDICQILFAKYRDVALKTGFGKDLYGSMIEHGAWPGNNTLWRSMLDLNRCVMFGTTDGTVSEQKQRSVFSLVDGIVAGEGQGPFNPQKKRAGVLVAGDNSLANDLVCTRLMGFNWKKMNTFRKILQEGFYAEDVEDFQSSIDLIVRGRSTRDDSPLRSMFEHTDPLFNFQPPVGWDDVRITSASPERNGRLQPELSEAQ